MYSFAAPPIKLKLGQQIGAGLLKANHVDQSLWWATLLSSSQILYSTPFSRNFVKIWWKVLIIYKENS
jgi:hypothetical protein